jgi:Pyruvate/2-oxoacid:ferredoxin oxidoreductase delta subunit/flavodoxin
MPKRIAIYYFTGTGNTQYVSEMLKGELTACGAAVDLFAMTDLLKSSTVPSPEKYDMIGLSHPVHGWGVPRIVYRFLKSLPPDKDKPTFLFKTAAGRGGLNDGTSRPVISALKKRGYVVFHDRAFMMPSNWMVGYPDDFSRQLCNAAAVKVKTMAAHLLAGKERAIRCSSVTALLTYALWLTENLGSHFFGRDLRATKKCTRCMKCIRECPMANISERGGKIRFGWNCVWCMHCAYSCPEGAIEPWMEKFFIIKGGYDLKKIVSDPRLKGEFVTRGKKSQFHEQLEYLSDPEL